MEQNIAQALDCDIDLINVKATTEEELGFTGRKEGIASKAVCLIEY
jgi:2-C-methyl-D-erythritol 2,4-cyclodiphosphate synthase